MIPYFYPTQFTEKQLYHNSFLILTETYLTFMTRVELLASLYPMAHLNNPQFL